MSDKSVPAKAAREWLHNHLALNTEAYKRFIESKEDIRLLILNDAFPYNTGPLPPQISGLVLPLLLRLGETTTAGHQFLRHLIAELVRSGEPVPDIWRKFHAGVLDGSKVEPLPPRGRKPSNHKRDEVILLLLDILQIRFGLPQLANPKKRPDESALEIIKDELKSVLPGLGNIEVDALRLAITRRRKLRERDPIIGLVDHRT